MNQDLDSKRFSLKCEQIYVDLEHREGKKAPDERNSQDTAPESTCRLGEEGTGEEGAAIAKLRTQSPTAVLQQMQLESLSCSFLYRCVQNCVTPVCPRRSGRDPECGLVLT